MTNVYRNQELDSSNYIFKRSFPAFLRRRPGEKRATAQMPPGHSLLFAVFVLFLAALFAAAAQAKSYAALEADVPFKFNIGNRTLHPGHYQLIILGNGLLAMLDSHHRVIASLLTRSVETGIVATENKIMFKPEKKYARLSQILLIHQSQVLEILGEQVAIRQAVPTAKVERDLIQSFLERQPSPPPLMRK
jgi:hypothetical protein